MKKEKIQGVPRKLRDEWRNLFNKSDRKKMSEGAAEISKVMTTAAKEQWRGANNRRRKAK